MICMSFTMFHNQYTISLPFNILASNVVSFLKNHCRGIAEPLQFSVVFFNFSADQVDH